MRQHLALIASLCIALPAVAADLPICPDPSLTPGAILTTHTAMVCQPGYSRSVRHTSGKVKASIYREYGLDRTLSHFEVDHLISLELGGADVAANLWPQSYDAALERPPQGQAGRPATCARLRRQAAARAGAARDRHGLDFGLPQVHWWAVDRGLS